MAGNVFFFTSGNTPNWDKTIAQAIDVPAAAAFLETSASRQLLKRAESGPVFAWGAQDSAVGTIAGMSDDDVVFGARRGLVGFAGLVALSVKEPVPHLSQQLWGAPSWPYVFFLYEASFAFRPVGDFLADMGERGRLIQGFRISHSASRLLRSVGSADEFIRIALTLPRQGEPSATEAPTADSSAAPQPEPTHDELGELGHSEAQADLMRIGEALGLSVWVAANDRGRVVREYVYREHTLDSLPFQGQPEFQRQIELIDVLWLSASTIRAAFEVEHSTRVYSGLLRLLDLAVQFPNISFPLFIVAPDADRRRVCAQLKRASFRQHRLSEICRYIPYSRLRDAVLEISRFGQRLDASVIEDYSEHCQ